MILFFKNKIIRFTLIFSIIFNLLSWILFYFRIRISTEPIILRYNIYTGISLIGPWYYVFYFSLAGLLILILNFILAKKFFLEKRILAYALAIISLICQTLILLYGVLIVVINS
jgi:hypothetical protein